MAIIQTAGKLIILPVRNQPSALCIKGDCDNVTGILSPMDAKKLVIYPDHPTATVEQANIYSRIRSQPINQAMNSPNVAYENEYTLPDTGIIDDSSA